MEALPIGIEPLKISELRGGYDWLYQFDNGYGASVILHNGSFGHEDGLYELAITRSVTQGKPEWRSPDAAMVESIHASEPGGDGYGIYGWLTLDEVARILGAIRGYATPFQQELSKYSDHTRYTVIDGEWKGTASDSW